jgi:hypothetical protein
VPRTLRGSRAHDGTRRALPALGSVAAAILCSSALAAQATDAAGLTQAFGDAARRRLTDPTLDARVHEELARGRAARWLEDVDLRFQVLQAPSEEAALGLAFAFGKVLSMPEDAGDRSIELVGEGDVAFQPEDNPDDFLTVGLRLRWSGTHSFGSGEPRLEKAANLRDPGIEELVALDSRRLGELSGRVAATPDLELDQDEDFEFLVRRYVDELERGLAPEWLWDFDLHAAFESDQELSSRQPVLGAALGARLLSWDPDSSLSRWNLFDLPAASLRWLAGDDERFRLSGRAYPTLITGLDVVDGSSDDTRGALTDDESFLRARLEAGVVSPALEIGDETLMLSARWRLFQEVDAPAAVRRADADESSHLRLELELPAGWVLSYTTGRLPLDTREESTFALGFEVGL